VRFRPRTPHVSVDLPAAIGEGPSVLSFSMAKAGSTLLYNILSQLAPTQGLVYFSIEDYLFSRNVSPTNRPGGVGKIIKPTGYCYGGFRQYPAFAIPILGNVKTTFLVRDPRDMITSLYFSLLSSHRIPAGEDAAGGGKGPASAAEKMLETRAMLNKIDINAFARQAIRTYLRIFEGYVAQGFARRNNVAIYRYEDVIFAKEAWIKDICEWYGWEVDEARQRAIAAMFDERPEEERPLEHIRQVTPGNHRAHFSAATIAAIDDALSEYMRLFGYLE
jgi:hypothetical protein